MKTMSQVGSDDVIHPNGVHHIAITTADMKKQIDFFCNVLGGELRALYWMHGSEGMFHGFIRMNDHSYIAFVQPPPGVVPEPVYGLSHAGGPRRITAGGGLQHLALNVDSLDDLKALRDRIRSAGYNCWGPIDHGFCQSMYFSGPENLSLEVATSAVAIDRDLWIDPEVTALVGLSEEDVERVTHAQPFEQPKLPVPQPPRDDFPPYMGRPEEAYLRLLAKTDDEIWESMSETTPPGRAKATV